jgi:hypothetical protein
MYLYITTLSDQRTDGTQHVHGNRNLIPVRTVQGTRRNCDRITAEQVFADVTKGPLSRLPSGYP